MDLTVHSHSNFSIFYLKISGYGRIKTIEVFTLFYFIFRGRWQEANNYFFLIFQAVDILGVERDDCSADCVKISEVHLSVMLSRVNYMSYFFVVPEVVHGVIDHARIAAPTVKIGIRSISYRTRNVLLSLGSVDACCVQVGHTLARELKYSDDRRTPE